MKRRRISLFFFISSLFVLIILFNCQSSSENQIIQNLRAFTKLYGYVKYFHPSDEASQIDWDKLAVYGAEKVKNTKSDRDLKAILEGLFLPIAPTIQVYHSGETPADLAKHFPENTTGLKVVTWQHKGVGFGQARSIYQSIRLNKRNKIFGTGQGFVTVTQGIDAIEYRGKEFKLKAHVKTDVSGLGNQGQLWLRVDRENKKIGFFDNMADRPIKTKEWREYEIKGKIDDDALKIFFGGFLNGSGRVWVDDFQLSVKNEKWEPVDVENPGFEEEDENHRPKKWFYGGQGYFFNTTEKMPYKGTKCLVIKSEMRFFTGKLFENHPEIGDVINKKLEANLFCQVPLALYSDENRTLGKNDKYPFTRLKSELEAIDVEKITADNESVRLANVVITWNVFQHFYPYFDVVNVDWDKELTNTLKETLTNKDEKDFFYTINRLVAKLQDGHAGVYHKIQTKEAGLPFKVDWIENQVVITVSKDPQNYKIGDIILAIDGKKAKQVLLDKEEYISGSPQWKRVKSLRRFGYSNQGTEARLKIRRRNEILEIEAERNFKELVTEPSTPNIQKFENNIYYVNLTKATMTEINEKISELAEAKGVIFDLRGYPKGNHQVICHLLREKDTSMAWMRVPQIIYPDQDNIVGWEKHGWGLMPKKPRIRAKVAFLTDGSAISYAESFMSFVEHHKLGEIVGQPTAGTNGNVNPIILPGGFRVTWTGMKVLKHDGSQHHLIGILPTVPMKRTIKGVIEGRDEFIEKALEIINR